MSSKSATTGADLATAAQPDPEAAEAPRSIEVAIFGEVSPGNELSTDVFVQSFAQAFKNSLSKPPMWIERYVLITPEDAGDILEGRRMSLERTPMKYTWVKYATSMDNTQFYGTLHTLKFGNPAYGDATVADGVEPMYDGQHRLLSIINTRRPQLMHVMFNVPKEAHAHIDTPRVRPQYTSLSFLGYTDAKLLNRLATRACVLKSGRRVFNGHLKPTIEQVMEVIDAGGVTEAARWAKAFRTSRLANDTAVGTAAYVILSESRADSLGERLDDFFNTLLTGVGLTEDNPIHVLRERLIKDWGKRGKLSENTDRQTHFILMSWTHWVEGTYTQQLRTPDSNAPLPRPA